MYALILSLLIWLVSHPGLNLAAGKPINDDATDSLSIQYIDLEKNPLLFNELKKFIKEQQDSIQLYRNGFGYISVGSYQVKPIGPMSIQEYDKRINDISFSFRMTLTSYVISDSASSICGDCFPLYYSFIDDKLVLIYDSAAKWFNRNNYSHKSKNLLTKLVKESLAPALKSDFSFKNMNQKSYFLSTDQRAAMTDIEILEHAAFVLNKGKTYIQYIGGNVKYIY